MRSSQTQYRRHATTFGVALLAAIAINVAQAKIYKTVDEEGNVVFTDVPPVSTPSEQVSLQPGSEYKPTVGTTAGGQNPNGPAATDAGFLETDAEPEVIDYRQVAITFPTPDLALRDNAGNVAVRWRTEPELQSGHVLKLLLDGQAQEGAVGPNASLSNVDRGTHVLLLQVQDDTGAILATSAPVTFHLQRFSALQRRSAP
ncbi:MAG: DUF4124 domain-containing protein [Pseudomonadota bacterium]